MSSAETDFTPPSSESPPRLLDAVPAAPRLLSFDVFNAMNFQIALGAPLVLMAHHWGASKLYIGLLTALVPLLTTLQIYMAPRIEYIGYRRVILIGWAGRNAVLGLVALLPLLAGVLRHATLLAVLFALMFAFNFMRGLATTGWLPWLSTLVPQAWRGRYLSIQQMAYNLSTAFTLLACGWVLGDSSSDRRFAVLYLISFAAGWISLAFLRHVECPPPRSGKPTVEPIYVWARRVWRERPIRRLLRGNAAYSLSMGAWLAFTIIFLREDLGLSKGAILYIGSASTLGGLSSAYIWGNLADRFGSRPVMALTTRLLLVVMICWLLLAMGLFPQRMVAVAVLYVLVGVGMVGFAMANTRYCMNNAPKAFPVLAMTLFAVVSSLSLALAPALWGCALDLLEELDFNVAGFPITSFTAFYGLTIVALLGTKWLIHRLPDSEAHPTHVLIYHMINDYPLRTLNAIYKSLFTRSAGANAGSD